MTLYIAASERVVLDPDTTLFDFNHSAMAGEHEVYTAIGNTILLEIDWLILLAPEPITASSVLKKRYAKTARTTLMFKRAEEGVLSAQSQDAAATPDNSAL